MFLIQTKLPDNAQNSSPSVNTMTYDVMLTFDIDDESKRETVYKILNSQLKFKKNWQNFDCDFVAESDDQEHKLPDTTFLLSKTSGYESKKALAEYLKASLDKIFSDEKVKGRYAFLIDKIETLDEINGAAFEF